MRYCETENLYPVIGCDSIAHYTAWGSTNCNDRGEAVVEFLNSSNLEILNQGNESTFCSGYRQEVIDITLGSFGLRKHFRLGGFFRALSVRPQTHNVHCVGLHANTP